MSTDITGWVEIKVNDHWFGVIKIDTLIGRNYRVFDFLFGGRSEDYENAIAGWRLPESVSPQAEREGTRETWIGLDELLAIDWEQQEDVQLTDDWKRLIQMMELVSYAERVTYVKIVCRFF